MAGLGTQGSPMTTHRCAVLGSPIAHSLSPLIHNTAYRVLGLTGWRYDAFEVAEDGLGAFIAGCGPEWVGLSCTMPLKRALLDFGVVSERAALLRSANTFLFGTPDEPSRVENTDVDGVLDPLRTAGLESARTAVLVGAGATARSALAAFAALGVERVVVVARDAGRALASLGDVAGRLGLPLDVRGWGEPGVRSDVVVSVLPVALDADLAAALVANTGYVLDAQYGHGTSAFAGPAADRGVVLLDGLDMLVAQARVQLRLMTGHECPAEPLLDAVRRRDG